MSKTLVINDLHLGVQRTGGTTNQSAAALRKYAHDKHRDLLSLAGNGDTVIVNGDLTDAYDIPLAEALEIFSVASEWLSSNTGGRLVYCCGNHDLSKDSAKMGTVQFIGKLLSGAFPGRFQLVERPTMLRYGIYVIPHLANQDLFDLELSRVPSEARVLLLHCNVDNQYAMQSDGSLNITRQQAKSFTDRGILVVVGHEHQQRDILNGKLLVVGNQFSTSVADCLGNQSKRALVLYGE